MRRGRIVTLWIVFGLGLLALIGDVYVSRDALLFRWKLRELAEWENGAYVAKSERKELSDEVKALEDWFLARPGVVLPRLRGEVRSADRRTQLAALELIWKIASDHGTKADPEDFWRAFEDTKAVESLIAQSFEAILIASWQSVHAYHESGVLFIRSSVDHSALLRVPWPDGPNGPMPVSLATLPPGSLNDDLRRRVARLASLPAFPELGLRWAASVQAQLFFLPEPGGSSSELEPKPVTVQLFGWGCLESVGNGCLNLAEGEWPVHLVPSTADESAPILCEILERGPKRAAESAAKSFRRLSLSPAAREAALSRLQDLAARGRRNKEWADTAIASLSHPETQ